MGNIIGKLSALFGYFCIATVLAQIILLGYVMGSGTLDGGKLDKMLQIAHSAEMVVPDATKQPASSEQSQEQASLEHVEHLRSVKWRNFEMRENILLGMLTEFQQLRDELVTKRDEFSRIVAKAKADLETQREEAIGKGRREFEAIYAGMKPKQAKTQLMMDYTKGKVETVVEVLMEMEESKRAKIVAEFKSEDDQKILNQILDNVRNPEVTLLDKTLRKLNDDNYQLEPDKQAQ